MPRQIRFHFPEAGIEAIADLLEERAPATCEAIWNALPFSELARHGIYSGSEILMYIPPEIDPPRENSTARVNPGDIGYYSFEERIWRDQGEGERVAEIAWFYDDDAIPRMPSGPVAVNVFAQFTPESLEQIRELGYEMRLDRAQKLEISRVE